MIHPTAIIGADPFWYTRRENGERVRTTLDNKGVELGDDVDVFPHAIVVNGTLRPTKVGNGVRISHRAQVGHDSVIGEHTVVGCGAIVCGFAMIGKRCTIGVGAIICPSVTVEDDCFIGAGVVVHEYVQPNTKITIPGGRRKNWDNLPWDADKDWGFETGVSYQWPRN